MGAGADIKRNGKGLTFGKTGKPILTAQSLGCVAVADKGTVPANLSGQRTSVLAAHGLARWILPMLSADTAAMSAYWRSCARLVARYA